MPTLEDIAQHIMKVAADPARLQAEAERIPDTAFTTAQAGCPSIDERLVLFSKCFGDDGYRDKFCSSRFSAACAKACMLATRSALPVSSVIATVSAPATAMQLWPAASP
jgi:hypothetical protein